MTTIEEKARRYDEALERAKNTIEVNQAIPDIVECVESLFPELAENKDEKIRKALIEHVKGIYKDSCTEEISKERDMFLAWLEKQSTDISSFPKEQQVFMKKYVSLDKITLIKLLAERDANNVEIIESFEKQGEQKPIKEHDICNTCDEKASCVIPCPTKLVEQKPAESGDIKSILLVHDEILNNLFERYKTSATFKTLIVNLQNWWNNTRRHLLSSNIEQKNAWSEEDEKMLDDILMCGEHHCYLDAENIDWLKSLKDRVQLKKEWSEEDETILKAIILNLEECSKTCAIPSKEYVLKCIIWLKSLKPQNHWKPSEEQMQTLYKYAEQNNYDGAVLTSLYNDIKKLK